MIEGWDATWGEAAKNTPSGARRLHMDEGDKPRRPRPRPPAGPADQDAILGPELTPGELADEHAELFSEELNPQQVLLPSGAKLSVRTDAEAEWVTRTSTGYLEQFKISGVSDLHDLDNIVRTELLLHRWGNELSSGLSKDPDKLAARIDRKESELRLAKKQLGVDAATRAKTNDRDSPAKWMMRVIDNAEQFGIHRNEQAAFAHTCLMRIIGQAGFVRKASAGEKRAVGMDADVLLDLILDEIAPAFLGKDEEWQKAVQQFWIEDM